MKKFFIYPILFLSVSAFAQHENCNHGSAPELASISGDIVEVPTTARHNINLTVEEARPLQIDNTITAIGSTEIIPQNIDHISSRISGKIKIIKIDEKTLDRYGEYTDWDRGIYADLVEKLNVSEEKRPAVIGFDVIFASERSSETDNRFAETCGKYGNVVCGFNYVFTKKI